MEDKEVDKVILDSVFLLGYKQGKTKVFEGDLLRELGIEPSKDPVSVEFVVTHVDNENKIVTLNSIVKEKI